MKPTEARPVSLVAWFALTAALLELGFMAGLKLQQHVVFNSLRIVWMTPAGYLLLFAPVLILVLALRRLMPARWYHVSIVILLVLTTFSFLSLFWVLIGRLGLVLLTGGLTVQAAQIILPRRAGFGSLVRRTLPWMAGLFLVAGIGVTARAWYLERSALAGRAARDGAPNVLLLVLDTVRGANLSLYGYPLPTTPGLARFGASGIVFEEAYSTASWTLPSIATMFTGSYPHQHEASWTVPLGRRDRTLADVFRDAGYATAGFAANVNYSSREVGLGRGFAHYEDYGVSLADLLLSAAPGRFVLGNPTLRRGMNFYDNFGRTTADELNASFLAWRNRHQDRPFFAYLNYYDAHEPYLPPSPFDTLFGPDTLRKNWLIRPKGSRDAHRIDKESMTPEERAAEERAYDGSVAYMDSRIEMLLADLDRLGLTRNTIVVITADHGELFGEHSLFTHGNSLYLPLLQVPLLLRGPALPRGLRVATPVTLRDLARTIVDLAGLDTASLPGHSLGALARGTDSAASGSPILAYVGPAPDTPPTDPVARGAMWSVIALQHQYIVGGDGAEELFDLVRDRAQLVNLAADSAARPVLERLRAVLDSVRRH